MSLKSVTLEQLEKNRNKSLSDEYLAKRFSVSQSAIWSAINELKEEGYQIIAIHNKGYQLSSETDLLSPEGIKAFLKDEYADINVMTLKSVDSTNRYAKNQVINGATHGTTIVSEEQTAGVGRFQRSFFSPAYTGIYMSVILKPNLRVSESPLITTSAAVAVCRAIKLLTAENPQIKWVNDIIINKKKICGILTEAITHLKSGTISSVIVGIGMNFNTKTEQFGTELQNIAGSLFLEETPNVTRNQLIAEILNNLFDITTNCINRNFMQEYRALSCVLGKNISVHKNNEWHYVKAVGIDDNGALIVENNCGSQQTLLSEEVSIRWE